MRKAIAVIGQGFVGNALSRGMQHAFDVYAYDKAGCLSKGAFNGARGKDGRDNLQNLIQKMELGDSAVTRQQSFSGVYFVCLPTPMNANGDADTSIVESTLAELAAAPGERIAVIKSTVPPGSTQKWNDEFGDKGLHVVFNPEFLTEANSVQDFKNQDRIVLGGPRPWINEVRDLFQIAYPNVPVYKTSSVNAELIKYVTNTFLAAKVSYANEIYQVCSALRDAGHDADYDRVIELAKLDKRLGQSHWRVPGPMPADDGSGKLLLGYGGSCFIKDVNALLFLAKTLGITPTVLQAAWDKNLEVRPERDWENLRGRAVNKCQ